MSYCVPGLRFMKVTAVWAAVLAVVPERQPAVRGAPAPPFCRRRAPRSPPGTPGRLDGSNAVRISRASVIGGARKVATPLRGEPCITLAEAFLVITPAR